MKRLIRTLAIGASVAVTGLVVSQKPGSADDYPCYACVPYCSLIDQELACENQCGGMEPAHPWQCFPDEYEYCNPPLELITECEDVG